MNILILNYEYPPLGGGAGVVTRYHAEGLAKLKNNVTVVTTWFEGEKEDNEKDKLRIIRLRSKRAAHHQSNPSEMLSWYFNAKKFLKTHCLINKFDLCLSHFTIPGGLLGIWLKKQFRIPYYIFSHGHDIPWFFPRQMLIYHLFLYRKIKKILDQSERNFLHTSEIKTSADNIIGQENAIKNTILPNGCDSSVFKPPVSSTSFGFKILFVGRLVSQKDPFTFLKAIKLFSENRKDFKVNILGDGKLKEGMEKYVEENGLKGIVNFCGWVSKERMINEYQSASLQVAPSKVESMSISLLESLFCGTYVIATPVSGNRELISDGINGEIVGYNNSEEIANKIDSFFIRKAERQFEIPEKFLFEFREKYDWNSIVGRLNEILIKDQKKF